MNRTSSARTPSDITPGIERPIAIVSTRRSGSRRTIRSTRASRARRSSIAFSRSPGVNDAAMTTRKSKTFQPLLKKSCGREPKPISRMHSSTTKIAEEHVVERRSSAARVAHDAVVGLQAEHGGVGQDDDEDEDVERRRVGELRAEADDRRAAVLVLAVVGGWAAPHGGAQA